MTNTMEQQQEADTSEVTNICTICYPKKKNLTCGGTVGTSMMVRSKTSEWTSSTHIRMTQCSAKSLKPSELDVRFQQNESTERKKIEDIDEMTSNNHLTSAQCIELNTVDFSEKIVYKLINHITYAEDKPRNIFYDRKRNSVS